MAIVYVKNKQNGVTYVYESEGYWDKEKQQSRSRRVCIGKLDESGQLIASKRLKSKTLNKFEAAAASKRLFYGAAYLLDQIGKLLGIREDLKKCFPDTYKKILSVAYYLVLEEQEPLSRFSKWAGLHQHPFGKDLPEPKMNELFASISETDRQRFFRLLAKRHPENNYRMFNIVSIGSYREAARQVKSGFGEPLSQLNLFLSFGEKSHLPLFYKELSGTLTDASAIKGLMSDIDFKHVKLVLNRSFAGEENIKRLYDNHFRFLTGVKTSLKYIEKEIDNIRETIVDDKNFISEYDLYATSSEVIRISENRHGYLHLYFSREKAKNDAVRFKNYLSKLKTELETDLVISNHFSQHEKFFEVKRTPKRGIAVTAKEGAITEAAKNFGFFALFSNDVKDPAEAVKIIRNKDFWEKNYDNLKGKMTEPEDSALHGLLFIEFIASIYIAHLKQRMEENQFFRGYTVQRLFDGLDVIECFKQPGKDLRLGEITKEQKTIYELLSVKPPK